MKRIVLALVALASLAAQVAYPYAIVNDKDSQSSATIYVFKDQDKYARYLKARGVPDDVISVAAKVAGAAPVVGGALAVPTEGISVAVATGVVLGVGAATSVIKALQDSGLMDQGILKLAGIVAIHRDVPPGNRGRGAEYSQYDIEKDFGIPLGGQLFVVITDKRNGAPLINTTMSTGGILGFTVKKNAKGELYAELSQNAVSQYEPSSIKSQAETWWSRAKSAFDDSTIGIGEFFGRLKDTAVSTYEGAGKAATEQATQEAEAAKKAEAAKQQQSQTIK